MSGCARAGRSRPTIPTRGTGAGRPPSADRAVGQFPVPGSLATASQQPLLPTPVLPCEAPPARVCRSHQRLTHHVGDQTKRVAAALASGSNPQLAPRGPRRRAPCWPSRWSRTPARRSRAVAGAATGWSGRARAAIPAARRWNRCHGMSFSCVMDPRRIGGCRAQAAAGWSHRPRAGVQYRMHLAEYPRGMEWSAMAMTAAHAKKHHACRAAGVVFS